jgi:hypothetical protein
MIDHIYDIYLIYDMEDGITDWETNYSATDFLKITFPFYNTIRYIKKLKRNFYIYSYLVSLLVTSGIIIVYLSQLVN